MVINSEQMVKDYGRGPAFKVALVNSPLMSGSWSLSAEKSRTFNFFTAQVLERRRRSKVEASIMYFILCLEDKLFQNDSPVEDMTMECFDFIQLIDF